MDKFGEFLNLIRNDKNLIITKDNSNEIFCRPKFGSKKIVRIPFNLLSELSFLAGVIVGDGHLTKDGKFRITLDMTNKRLVNFIKLKFNKTFSLDLKLKKKLDKRQNRQTRWKIEFNNKVIWSLFNRLFKIPFGIKSDKVEIPDCIKEDIECLKMFISGLFLADGDSKNGRISFTCSSEKLFSDIKESLNRFNIFPFTSKWLHKKSKKIIFDVIIGKKDDINIFKNTFPFVFFKLSRGCQVWSKAQEIDKDWRSLGVL